MPDDQNPQLPLEGVTPPNSGTNLIPINIEEEMRRSYLDYSMSVIIGRALPDARDGLKPVHRRVLYTLSEMGLEHNKKYTKCAKVVGQAMGVYHPHGDSAIYDTLVRMRSRFRCAIRWWTGRATSALWMAIRRRPCATPSAA